MILTGKKAEEVCRQIMAGGTDRKHNWGKPYVSGFFVEDNVWIAFDNTTKNFWTEEFISEKEAKVWCKK